MKTFIKYWTGAVLAGLVIPSVFMALSTVMILDGGSFLESGSLLFIAGTTTFFTTMLIVGTIGFTPAIAVLVIGLGVCWVRDQSKRTPS